MLIELFNFNIGSSRLPYRRLEKEQICFKQQNKTFFLETGSVLSQRVVKEKL